MITRQEEADILARAYVPEHIVSLMTLISKGEPFLIEDCLGFFKDDWLILVGYPLEGPFSEPRCDRILRRAVETYRPGVLWFIGPEAPPTFEGSSGERETDQYYTLHIGQMRVKPALHRAVEKAAETLTVEREGGFGKEHNALIGELLERADMPDRVRELYRAMPGYVGRSSSARVLNARNRAGKLCAFTVVELGAQRFSAYILGSHSKRHYAPHASDLLFSEMIRLTEEQGKGIMNLGLGVNEGIRRFKQKWSGQPSLRYEFRERRYRAARGASLLDALMGRAGKRM